MKKTIFILIVLILSLLYYTGYGILKKVPLLARKSWIHSTNSNWIKGFKTFQS